MRYSLRTLLIVVCAIPLILGSVLRLPFSRCYIVTATFAENPPSDIELCRWLAQQPGVRNCEVSTGQGFTAVLWDITRPLASPNPGFDLRYQFEKLGYKGLSRYEQRSVFLGMGTRSRREWAVLGIPEGNGK
jgi:hypothetical protein